MKKPKMFRSWSDSEYRALIWFFVLPIGIYLIGRLIILLVLLFG